MNTYTQLTVTPAPTQLDCSPNDYDLVREIIQRQEVFRRCDEYISNPEFEGELQNFWGAIKSQEDKNLERLHTLIIGQGHGLWLRLPDL